MGLQQLKSLNERHLEAARLVALGKQNAEVCEQFQISCKTIIMWKRSVLFREKVAEYQKYRDDGLVRSFQQSDSAKALVKSAEQEAVEELIAQLRHADKPLHRYRAAIEILKLSGYYTTPQKSGEIVVNITAEEIEEMREGARQLGLVEDSSAA